MTARRLPSLDKEGNKTVTDCVIRLSAGEAPMRRTISIQFIVVAIGARNPAELIALALPK